MGGSSWLPGSRLITYAFTMRQRAKNATVPKSAAGRLIQHFFQMAEPLLLRALLRTIWPS
jgi:hypothetical protein